MKSSLGPSPPDSPTSPTTVLEGKGSSIQKPRQQPARPPPASQVLDRSRATTPEELPGRLAPKLDQLCQRIVQVIVPVTLCAVYCCALVRVLSMDLSPDQAGLLDLWRHLGVNVATGPESSDSSATRVSASLFMVAALTVLIILATFVILLVFYLQWHQCLIYYLYLPSFIILAILTPAFIKALLQALNWFALDIYTFLLVVWNFAALGMMAIFGLLAPTCLCLQQFYLVHNSAILSVVVIHALPGWAPWLLLIFLAVWDLFAVLAPYGPLSLIIELAEKEGVVEMPGLIYSTDLDSLDLDEAAASQVVDSAETANGHDSPLPASSSGQPSDRNSPNEGQLFAAEETKSQNTRASVDPITIRSDGNAELDVIAGQSQPVERTNDELANSTSRQHAPKPGRRGKTFIERGVSIGLGDFIFYSLLIGLASRGRHREDFYSVLTTLVAVLFGLVVTLFILALTKRSLPALPISIGLGSTAAGLTIMFVPQLSNRLATASIFV